MGEGDKEVVHTEGRNKQTLNGNKKTEHFPS
jgi:hypothetical protein